jgi:hypothetical protein
MALISSDIVDTADCAEKLQKVEKNYNSESMDATIP